LNPPVNHQNDRVWSVSKKRDVNKRRLVVERAKFSKHVMVSAGVCYGAKVRLHKTFQTRLKVNYKFYCEILLTRLVEDCKSLLPSGFIFQQDGAPAHTAKLAQNWIAINCSDFIGKEQLNSPDLNRLDYYVWGAMLERYKTLQRKPNTIDELKKVLQTIWDDLPQNSINKAILSFIKRLRACVKLEQTLCTRLQINCDSLKYQISVFRLISTQAL